MDKRNDNRDQGNSVCTKFSKQCKRACRELLTGLGLNDPVPGTTCVSVEVHDDRKSVRPNKLPRKHNSTIPMFTKCGRDIIDRDTKLYHSSQKETRERRASPVVQFAPEKAKEFNSTRKEFAHQGRKRLQSFHNPGNDLRQSVKMENKELTEKAESIVDETIINAIEMIKKKFAPNSIISTTVTQNSAIVDTPRNTTGAHSNRSRVKNGISPGGSRTMEYARSTTSERSKLEDSERMKRY